jgi:hypothetical protein
MSIKRALAFHVPQLPELPEECIQLILKFACEAAVSDRVSEFNAVFAIATDIFRDGEHKLKTETFECLSRHIGVVSKHCCYIFQTMDLYKSELRGLSICKRDDVSLPTSNMEPSSRLFICDEYGDEFGEWDEERMWDGVVDTNFKPCLLWGNDAKMSYSISLCSELSARVHIETVRVPTRAFSNSTEEGRWGIVVATPGDCEERVSKGENTEFLGVVEGWTRV